MTHEQQDLDGKKCREKLKTLCTHQEQMKAAFSVVVLLIAVRYLTVKIRCHHL